MREIIFIVIIIGLALFTFVVSLGILTDSDGIKPLDVITALAVTMMVVGVSVLIAFRGG